VRYVPSFWDQNYPQPHCAAVISITARGNGTPSDEKDESSSWNAHLDLRRAAVMLDGNQKQQVVIRNLARRNVFLIEGPGMVTLEEVKVPQVPPANLGETAGVKWIHMVMPGDIDYDGMEYAMALAEKGDIKAVSLVTSFDTEGNVLESALQLAAETLDQKLKNLIASHESDWEAFWSASGVELDGPLFQDAWYRNLYYMRCFCRAGTPMPVTLYAGLVNDHILWHGAPTLDYNFEQTFWPTLSSNHVDLMEPYVRFIGKYAPRARWMAKKTWGLDGLFLPVQVFGPEHLVDPEKSKSRNARQISFVPEAYSLSCTGWGLQNLWLRYKYMPDIDYLESVYPLLRDGAEFYANVVGECRDDDGDGKIELGPSYNPEHGPFGTYNNPVDIAYFNSLLQTAAEAAGLLNRDQHLAERWARSLDLLPRYETALLEGESIVANWKGAGVDAVEVHNLVAPSIPVYPANQVTWFSSPEEKQLFERTIRWIKHNGNNSHIIHNVQRARLSMPEAYSGTLAHFDTIDTPNGLYAGWPGHGYYLAESWAFAGLTAELLMQSVNDIIRIFPAWPEEHDARYVDLRAQGGFLVSAEQNGGETVSVRIRATADGQVRLLDPFPGRDPDWNRDDVEKKGDYYLCTLQEGEVLSALHPCEN